MKKACVDQCKVCPFRSTSAPGWLGGYRAIEVFDALWHGAPFFCHSRTNYKPADWEARASRNGKLCLGALVAANRWGHPQPKDPEIRAAREAAASYDREHPGEVVTMQPREFVEHHKYQEYLDAVRRA